MRVTIELGMEEALSLLTNKPELFTPIVRGIAPEALATTRKAHDDMGKALEKIEESKADEPKPELLGLLFVGDLAFFHVKTSLA